MKNNIILIINDNILSTLLFKKLISDNLLNIELVILENKEKKKSYIFFILFFKNIFFILIKFFISLIKNDNIKSICKNNEIKYLLSKSFKENIVIDTINKCNSKNIFFINIYNKLDIKNFKKKNLINIHLGDTQKYRGVFCLIHSIINREIFFYITSHFIVNDFDKGDIIYQKKYKIYNDDLFLIYRELFLMKSEVIYESLKLIEKSIHKKNLNLYEIYKPPSLYQIFEFFKFFYKYPVRPK